MWVGRKVEKILLTVVLVIINSKKGKERIGKEKNVKENIPWAGRLAGSPVLLPPRCLYVCIIFFSDVVNNSLVICLESVIYPG